MQQFKTYLALAALLFGSVLLEACGNGDVHTSTPSSTLGSDSSATKVGGTVNGPTTGSTSTANTAGATVAGNTTGASTAGATTTGSNNTTPGGTTSTSQ
ncbi:MAG: hypothetical protein ACRYFV_10040 [Janthinobacterium lividum]|jgi:hypothetical protein